jgi:hypothetical protein
MVPPSPPSGIAKSDARQNKLKKYPTRVGPSTLTPSRFGSGNPPRGFVTGLFLFLYSFLRIPVDVFREYPTSLLGLATGQALNLAFSVIGVIVMVLAYKLKAGDVTTDPVTEAAHVDVGGWRKPAFVLLLLFCLTIPSDWTQDIAARYGHRHPGLVNSTIYPRIAETDLAAE